MKMRAVQNSGEVIYVDRKARAPSPIHFIVMSMLILILGVLSIFRTPVDIFPVVDIPVVSVIWNLQRHGTRRK